jgi:hypothetical protein
MATRAKNRKIFYVLHRSNYWWDFNETSYESLYTVLGDLVFVTKTLVVNT